MQMKVLTLYPSYAMLVCAGLKQYETRSWTTDHRGLLAIHAAKWASWPPRERNKFFNHPMHPMFKKLGFDRPEQLPDGAIIGQVRIDRVMRITSRMTNQVGQDEINLGHWNPNWYAWKLEDAVLYPEPIEAIGRQGIWTAEVP